MRDCFICVAKIKALISCVVTAQLFCGFVFAYAKSRFSHDVAHLIYRFLFFTKSGKHGKSFKWILQYINYGG